MAFHGKHTAKSRAKMSAKRKAWCATPAGRAAVARAGAIGGAQRKGGRLSERHKARLRKAAKRRPPVSAKTRKRIADGVRRAWARRKARAS